MEDFLNHALSEVSRQHQVLESECRLLRELLKPWPKKRAQNENIEDKEQKTEAQAPSEKISHAERQVDELLRKAQRALHLKSKVMESEDERLRLQTSVTNSDEISNACASEFLSFPVDNKDLDIKSSRCKAIPSSVPSPQLDSLSKQTSEIISSQPVKQLLKRNGLITKKSYSATTERSTESKHESSRPRSHRTLSGRGHHIPAHRLAPFKTSDDIHYPKRRHALLAEYGNSARTAVKKPQSAGAKSLSLGAKTYKTLPSITPRDSLRPIQKFDTCKCPVTLKFDPNTSCVQEISSSSLSGDNHVNVVEGTESTDDHKAHIGGKDTNSNSSSVADFQAVIDRSEYSSVCTHTSESDQSSRNAATTQSSLQELELPQFTLQKNGSSIKLPNKLTKLVHINTSLRKRLSTAQLAKKTSTLLPAQQFVDRLCAEMDISTELRTRLSALTCLRSHQLLLDMLQDLQLSQLSENTSTEILYRVKKTVEFILTTFAELQDEASYHAQVKYRQITPPSVMTSQYGDQKATLWLDSGQKRDSQDGVWKHLQTSRHWNHLTFTEKYLQLIISLVNTAEAEWWHVLLEDRDLSVFQGVYSLLTSHGQCLPALVENQV